MSGTSPEEAEKNLTEHSKAAFSQKIKDIGEKLPMLQPYGDQSWKENIKSGCTLEQLQEVASSTLFAVDEKQQKKLFNEVRALQRSVQELQIECQLSYSEELLGAGCRTET